MALSGNSDDGRAKKRLIMCCDGTWMNSAYGYLKPGLLNGKGGLQVPSNVTRISRCFKRRCDDDRGTYKWHDTALSDRIENAFQALALDETRPPFGPALWERPRREGLATKLKQVWFPGNHGSIGGGWEDQGLANCTLAWMMDQMASVGVEFDKSALDRVIGQTDLSYRAQTTRKSFRNPCPWAVEPIVANNEPLRPWALGAMRKVTSLLFKLSGETTRTPGAYKQIDPKTKRHERVHSSVRVRLACGGLGLDDETVWSCPALASWKLTRKPHTGDAPPDGSVHSAAHGAGNDDDAFRVAPWAWEYVGVDAEDGRRRTMWEEPLGDFERYLLQLSGGKPNVYTFADSGQRQK